MTQAPLAFAKMTTLNGKPWCIGVFKSPAEGLQPLMTEKEVEKAEFEAEKYDDWSSDY